MDKILPLEYPLDTNTESSVDMPTTHDPTTAAQQPDLDNFNGGLQTASLATTDKQASSDQRGWSVQIASRKLHLRCRPGELYLGANTTQGQMQIVVFFDEHVYENAVAQEWLGEVRDAAVWYLGGNV
jgi:hypothetical protein